MKIVVFGDNVHVFCDFLGIPHIFMKCAHRRPALPKTLLGQCFFNGSGGLFSAQTPKGYYFWSFPHFSSLFMKNQENAGKTRKVTLSLFRRKVTPTGRAKTIACSYGFRMFRALAVISAQKCFFVEVCTFTLFHEKYKKAHF